MVEILSSLSNFYYENLPFEVSVADVFWNFAIKNVTAVLRQVKSKIHNS